MGSDEGLVSGQFLVEVVKVMEVMKVMEVRRGCCQRGDSQLPSLPSSSRSGGLGCIASLQSGPKGWGDRRGECAVGERQVFLPASPTSLHHLHHLYKEVMSVWGVSWVGLAADRTAADRGAFLFELHRGD